MLRKTMIALLATASVGLLTVDTASARGGFGGGGCPGGGGFHGGGGLHGGAFRARGGGGGFRSAAIGGGWHGGGWHGGGWHGGYYRRGWGYPFAAAAIGFGLGYGAYDYYDSYYNNPYYAGYGYDDGYGYGYGDGGCYVVRRAVLTPYGRQVRPVQVCN